MKRKDPEDPTLDQDEEPAKKKQCAPAKRWCFTMFNYPEDWEKLFANHTKLHKYVIGEEVCPTTQRKHLQGYLELKKKGRPMELKLPNSPHFEKARGDEEANFNYCTKEGRRVAVKGITPPYEGPDIVLTKWEKKMLDILEAEPDDRSIHWVWEPKGKLGKTTWGKWLYCNTERVIVLSGKASDMKNGILQYKEKSGVVPRTVIVNLPRSVDTDFFSWTGLEEIKDMFFFAPKYEGGMICDRNPHLVVFANVEPPVHKLSMDRWVVHQITGDDWETQDAKALA